MNIAEFIFGKSQPKMPIKPVTSEELQKETANEVDKIKAQASLYDAKTELAKAKSRYEKVMATMPRTNVGLVGLLAKKSTWYIIVGFIFFIIIIKAMI